MAWFRSGGSRGFLAGFVVASLLFGGMAMAQDVVQREIQVSYLPLKFIFDGVEKAPPADQQGFTYNSRTFVPLRFMGEALGKKIDYDPATYTIYVGRRPAPLPDVWKTYKLDGDGSVKVEYFSTGALTLSGQEMPNAMLLTAMAPKPADTADEVLMNRTTSISTEIALQGKYKKLTGTLFVPDHYFGQVENRQLVQVTILNEVNQILYKSNVIMTRFDPLPIDVPVTDVQKVRIFVSLFHNQGYDMGGDLVATHIGLADLKWE